jgi:hypothetical protein
MKYLPPGLPGSIVSAEPRYENFIVASGWRRRMAGTAWTWPQAWHQEQFLLDVAPGEPEDFSLPAGDNLHFVTRSPACVSPDAPGGNVLSPPLEWSTP